jgi:dTMP kinase
MSELINGQYLVIEGSDGAGKTTQAKRLLTSLIESEVSAKELIEPGGTEIGILLRGIILKPDLPKLPESEFDLFTVARRELTKKVIRPAVNNGTTVVCDRNWFSSVAYQGFGRGLDVRMIIERTKQAMGDYFMPDGVVILDVPLEVAEERISSRTKSDWFEQQGREFFENVKHGYEWLAEKYNIVVIDGTQNEARVANEIFLHLGNTASLS